MVFTRCRVAKVIGKDFESVFRCVLKGWVPRAGQEEGATRYHHYHLMHLLGRSTSLLTPSESLF